MDGEVLGEREHVLVARHEDGVFGLGQRRQVVIAGTTRARVERVLSTVP